MTPDPIESAWSSALVALGALRSVLRDLPEAYEHEREMLSVVVVDVRKVVDRLFDELKASGSTIMCNEPEHEHA